MFFLAILFAIVGPFILPILINKVTRKILPNTVVRISISIVLGLLFSFTVSLAILDSILFTKPIEKKISKEYYFKQFDYGMAFGGWGQHLNFYKKRKYWFDKKIGHIHWLLGGGETNAHFKVESDENIKELVLDQGGKVVLDTTLDFDKGFEFDYLGPDLYVIPTNH